MLTVASGFVFLAGAVFTAFGTLAIQLADQRFQRVSTNGLQSDAAQATDPAGYADEVIENPDGSFTYRDRTFRQRSSAEEYKRLIERLTMT